MNPDVVIIGAGPAGTVAASMLADAGFSVEVLERVHFPRFSIGESLLPQAMEWLAEADLLRDVVEAGFQHKNGAMFRCGDKEESFDFRTKSAAGWGTTYQVRRDRFDELLARGAERKGAKIHFGQTVIAMRPDPVAPSLTVCDEAGNEREVTARFVLDASGFGRVLARLLDLETPTSFPERMSIFTHVEDNIPPHAYDRNKILITVNPKNSEIWYWMIPLADGLCSMGVVGKPGDLAPYGATREEQLAALVAESGLMAELLVHAKRVRDVGEISGYACRVSSLTGPGYALLGNAGEFLDPVFSSGVTIALKSASLAAHALTKQLRGGTPDWDAEFAQPLSRGVETFRAYVTGWYDGSLQKIIFSKPADARRIKSLITSVLAGYAWDDDNPFVRDPNKYLKMVEAMCE
ncbi:MAG: NAD(P)/FAD-dependent oxidoreductase [Parvibaculum sp.]